MIEPDPKADKKTPKAPHAAEPAGAATPAAPWLGLDAIALEAELARVAAERDTYLDHLRRLKAEFENYRKRMQRESDSLRKLAAEDVIGALLPVIDNMYRACSAAERHDEGQVVEGVEKVTGQLVALLSSQGLQELPISPGDPFDPTIHEAVMMLPTADHEEGAIVSVLERGYMLHDKLLRPARVIVASRPAE
jgi:molecular chaperone GrpE